ncbi:unnamed protein product [Rangifer tarandus platyrhynchus]|uniref:Uncharacterized protein n=1 Tax=Rangifer tarandus platyrhynchus TaxID=3082113 RepID=A0ABN8ZW13_RANTA|nr:unnamed protein product [Rangifer tarandus platyrhynchus]
MLIQVPSLSQRPGWQPLSLTAPGPRLPLDWAKAMDSPGRVPSVDQGGEGEARTPVDLEVELAPGRGGCRDIALPAGAHDGPAGRSVRAGLQASAVSLPSCTSLALGSPGSPFT